MVRCLSDLGIVLASWDNPITFWTRMVDEDFPVMYCSYGSNMSLKRFMAYISGGKVPLNTKVFRGCRDKSPPAGCLSQRVPFALTFAGESATWGGGGVAFLDSRRLHDDEAKKDGAIVRCYRIKFSQWREVAEQENGDAHFCSILPASLVSDLQ